MADKDTVAGSDEVRRQIGDPARTPETSGKLGAPATTEEDAEK